MIIHRNLGYDENTSETHVLAKKVGDYKAYIFIMD